ncbi:hypothetical protein PHLGIDRAFT_399665 [Phlebiopsis gigantea 11061_1 CR5-6]|uniref:WD repeat-containing protein 75 second beta-propeller domain-containing protein n=1 Tax=Phlebiopsis gigantea (strain 11061_1 CR5-6) TaxID=745531 RepID=A0A0C3S6U0_PHLG1|nr:hypothetical protein PHLGIDRAFT_399665 [Phlebiopsis gigantea 11061_1 CR5-6]
MPVAVDAPPGGASTQQLNNSDSVPLSQESPKKLRASKRAKKLEAEVAEQPIAGSSNVTDEWAWRSLAESSASNVPPVFTRDGSYFFSASGPAVKIHSVETGSVVSTLNPANSSSKPAAPTGYGDAVTSMVLSPHNPFQLLTASMDGCIRLWDFVDAVLLQTIDIAKPILQIAAHEKFKGEVCIAISRGTKKLNANRNPTGEDNAAVMNVSLTPTEATRQLPVQKPSSTRVVGKARYTFGLSYSPSGAWLVAIGGHKAYVCRTSDLKAGFTKLVSPEKLTCLAFHPTEDFFATGDNKGIVRLWYCLNDSIPTGVPDVEKKAPTTTLHWHAHAVSSLTFTANGAYLLSGGEEAVLVIWQLHTGKKEFVPRVGAPISSITLSTVRSREEEYLLGLSDASFAFVRSGTLRISRTIAKVKLDPAITTDRPSPDTPVPLAAHSISSSLVLPSSHPSSLQTYSPLTSTLISELEVSPTNRVSRREEKTLEPSRVEFATTSDSGDWLATVDSRPAVDGFRGEVYLKIWWWDRKASTWVLNTRIDRPHGLKKVTTVTFRPRVKDVSALSLVTAGQDGSVKIWGIRSATNKSGATEHFWVARSSLRSRSENPSHVAWSYDGSLMSVASGSFVVLYDPATTLALRTIMCPECESVSSTTFIGKASRYLAIQSRTDLVLWDLVTDDVQWQYQSLSTISQVFSHHREESFVVLESDARTSQTYVSKFTPSSSSPTSSHTLPFSLISTAPCPPRWLLSNDPSSFAFVGITHTWSAVIFGDHIRLAEGEETSARGLAGAASVTTQTLFQDIFGRSAFTDLSARNANVAVPASQGSAWKGKEVERIFDTPAYLLPPLGSLFDPLMDEFLTPRTDTDAAPSSGANKYAERQDVDVDMEGVEGPILVGNRLERVIDQREMATMIELFKHHGLHYSGFAGSLDNQKARADQWPPQNQQRTEWFVEWCGEAQWYHT